MKTNSTPQTRALRAIRLSLIAAGFTAAGAFVLAQQPAPVAPKPEAPSTQPPAGILAAPVQAGGAPPALPSESSPRGGGAYFGGVPADPATFERGFSGAGNVAGVAVDEEFSPNPQDVARKYEGIVAEFDHQRGNAAQAVFRLGEAYRKLDRLDEARIQYARILREFVDFPDLARLSQKQLSVNAPRTGENAGVRGGGAFGSAVSTTTSNNSADERQLLQEELGLLEKQLGEIQERVKSGVESTSAVIPIQRDILHLRQQLLRFGKQRNGASASESVLPPRPAPSATSSAEGATPPPSVSPAPSKR